MDYQVLMQNYSSRERKEFELSVTELKKYGAQEIYIFGSMARGGFDESSDWDFAVRGISPADGLRVQGILLSALSRSVDLVDLDDDPEFALHLQKKEEFIRVA